MKSNLPEKENENVKRFRELIEDPETLNLFIERYAPDLLNLTACHTDQKMMIQDQIVIYWLSQRACTALRYEMPHVYRKLPQYIQDEVASRDGRPGHGRLWVPKEIRAQLSFTSIAWDASKPAAVKAEVCGGIVIWKRDMETLMDLPGFITDIDLNLLRDNE